MRIVVKKSPAIQPDEKLIQVVAHPGHLFIYGQGCCFGRTERGFAPSLPNDTGRTLMALSS
jgi:hypothetical protein